MPNKNQQLQDDLDAIKIKLDAATTAAANAKAALVDEQAKTASLTQANTTLSAQVSQIAALQAQVTQLTADAIQDATLAKANALATGTEIAL